MYPTQVKINEQNINRLISTYKKAQQQILNEIAGATDFGVYNRQQILAQIEQILSELAKQSQEFIEKEIPEYYKSGADDAIKQLKNIDAPIEVDEGYNRIHQDAITGLVDDTARAFGEGMSGVNRSANRLLGRAVRERVTQQMAKGLISGDALRTVRQQIKGELLEDGLTALVDRGGRGWTLDRYGDMLFRTKAVESRNRGVANRLVENGYDLVQVSAHLGSCPQCSPWQGKILSASGATKGYPTVRDAENGGLFHPNCRHAINVMIPKLANLTEAYNPNKPTKVVKQPPKTIKQPAKANSVKIGKYEIKTTKQEADFIKSRNIEVVDTRLKELNTAQYWQKSINGENKLKFDTWQIPEKEIQKTFFHELGHAIDYRANTKVVQKPSGSIETFTRLTKTPEVKRAIRNDRDYVVTQRANETEMFAIGYDFTPEQKKVLVRGETVPVKNKFTGKIEPMGLNKRFLAYYRSEVEVFADGYAQYRTNKEEFEKNAPHLANIFKELLK